MNKVINFQYNDGGKCWLRNKDFTGQCCCKCSYRVKVVAHCLHVNEIPPESCNCGNDMGFYVCTAFDDMEPRTGTASVCGSHGLCECFTKRKAK